jgi:hypothetical protein
MDEPKRSGCPPAYAYVNEDNILPVVEEFHLPEHPKERQCADCLEWYPETPKHFYLLRAPTPKRNITPRPATLAIICKACKIRRVATCAARRKERDRAFHAGEVDSIKPHRYHTELSAPARAEIAAEVCDTDLFDEI